ncbi:MULTISPECIES: hypothetical protein [unclassified Acidisoma]|jgi:hypothetical protein|uniref:hypothetical protein n=1 Tax=unclassified Acidisoma TaxID=2634065 RepID=UPI00131E44B3|nr:MULTISPECIES: hypothetical protein [unclassified Acidisoma]
MGLPAAAVLACMGSGLAQAACTQNDIKLKYTEIGQLIQAEMAGSLSNAQAMMTQMHMIQDQMTTGEINSDQFCRQYDALIREMKTR